MSENQFYRPPERSSGKSEMYKKRENLTFDKNIFGCNWVIL
jgi:hypothetical protein